MVDFNNIKSIARLQGRKFRAKRDAHYATQLEAKAARMYADDVDMRHGALSAPIGRTRPGQRDDEVNKVYGRIIPAL